jgi:hypothetical protein
MKKVRKNHKPERNKRERRSSMSIWSRFFGKRKSKTSGPPPLSAIKSVDFRSEKERQIEREAFTDKSLGEEADQLVAELIEIGRTDGYITTTQGSKFDSTNKNIRAREIGEALNEIGDMDLMKAACYKVRATLGGLPARHLEAAWARIGQWMP